MLLTVKRHPDTIKNHHESAMRYNNLGRTEIKVSEICLGSMTWGTQNTSKEAHAQIDMALDYGVNFIDTAEMYPTTPLGKETQGDTERIIGEWVARSGRRANVIIATKVSGKGYKNVRNGAAISPATITQAIDASLRSLRTDYIDLYQLHWPNRGSYMFRQNWTYDPSAQDTDETLDHMIEVLQHLDSLRAAGKIRHVGLSNETVWGTMRWLSIAAAHNLPRMVSIQNEYSLLCRLFDLDMAEMAHHEKVGLLSFSPLAAGLLSGKYADGAIPDGSRRSINADLGGRINTHLWPALDAYIEVARTHNLNPCQMALAWAAKRPFMTSQIIGATTNVQLSTALESTKIELSDAVMRDIQNVYRRYPMPY
jgi:aryl-alcohol dehydrogenase-like predicted oxidoreductase